MPFESDDKLKQVNELARQLEQRLRVEDLSRISDGRRKSASRLSGFAIFIGGCALLLMVGLVVGLSRAKVTMDERLTGIESQVNGRSAQTFGPARNQATTASPTNGELEGRMSALENLQAAWVAASKSALEQMNFVFAVVAAFFGVFSLFLAYRQVVTDSGREAHEDEVRSLIGSFRQNMAVINDLIVTLEKNYSYRQEVEKQLDQVNSQLTKVKEYKERAEQSFDERISTLNADAYTIFFTPLDRQNFKAGNLRNRLDTFSDAMNTLERTGSVEGRVSPFAFFIRSLHEFNVARYTAAEKDLEDSRIKATRELGEPTLKLYGEVTSEEVKTGLKQLLADSAYHLGIIKYNSGGFDKARKSFMNAFRATPLDFRSRIYVPELLFFEMAPFDEVVREFALVEQELNAVPLQDRHRMTMRWEEAMASLKMREGNIYLPKTPSLPERAAYGIRENARLAAAAYQESVKYSEILDAQDGGKTSLPRTFARFSLAQALYHLNRSEYGGKDPAKLYQQAFNELMNETVFKTEPVILVQLNYTMAICSSRLERTVQPPEALFAKAREQLQRVPDTILVFSPVNKVLRRRDELISEMQSFEERNRHATAAKA